MDREHRALNSVDDHVFDDQIAAVSASYNP